MYAPVYYNTVDADRVEVVFACFKCNKDIPLTVSEKGFKKWTEGGLVQDCFPELNASERELFISGICTTCFDKMFPEE